MSRTTRLIVLLAAVAVLVAPASAGARRTAAPTNLHAFLLRVDEPAKQTFSRTPAYVSRSYAITRSSGWRSSQ